MNITGYHNGQPIVDSIPDGWKVDTQCGSPLHGYVYIHNGAFSKRMLAPCPAYQAAKDVADHVGNGNNKVEPTVKQFSLLDAWTGFLDGTRNKGSKKPAKVGIDEDTRRTMNNLSRLHMTERLLRDILFDLEVCRLEGWDCREYIHDLQGIVNGLVSSQCDRKEVSQDP